MYVLDRRKKVSNLGIGKIVLTSYPTRFLFVGLLVFSFLGEEKAGQIKHRRRGEQAFYLIVCCEFPAVRHRQ